MAEAELQTIPARKGAAAKVSKGQNVKVINTHGFQIVDTWAFNAADLAECMSMEHCRVALDGLRPKVGDSLVTNQRRPHPHLPRGHLAGRPRHAVRRLRHLPLP